jgi:hypothetical protein
MKERPILFSAPMVRAILEGRKSQTRRVVKPQPGECDHSLWPGHPSPDWRCDSAGWVCMICGNGAALTARDVSHIRCPYGQPSDRLWVKETWRPRAALGPWDVEIDYAADGATRTIRDGEFGDRDWTMPKAAERGNVSPLFMPRWASRITLEVTGVRVERLQDISEADAKAEGVESDFASSEYIATHGGALCGRQFRYAYAELWNQINGAGAYHANPWVWAVEFKRIEATP